MQLIFLHGPLASGKLTVARAVAARTGLALFHNHLIVDAVGAVFPFGSPEFCRLREAMWLQVFEAAAGAGRSLIFTFAPEGTVSPEFAENVIEVVQSRGGRVRFFALTLADTEQDRRVAEPSRADFGKLRDPELLRKLRAEGAFAYPPLPAELSFDTAALGPDEIAEGITAQVGF